MSTLEIANPWKKGLGDKPGKCFQKTQISSVILNTTSEVSIYREITEFSQVIKFQILMLKQLIFSCVIYVYMTS